MSRAVVHQAGLSVLKRLSKLGRDNRATRDSKGIAS